MKNKIIILLLILLNSCNCQEEEPLEEVLGQPCHGLIDGGYRILDPTSSSYEALNIGECVTGTIQEDENGEKACIGQVKIHTEECNNLDDDCNGIVDDEWQLWRYPSDRDNTCVGVGVCKYAQQYCSSGQWYCDYPASYGNEVCDGLDNDCDGETDEDSENDPIIPPEERYVYTGDPATINVGECRAGYRECVNGETSIRNMRTPVPEICGNDDDDDCDGLTDEPDDDIDPTDFLLVIDYSGSMTNIIDSVATALCTWSTQGVLQSSRFAVVAIGYIDSDDPNNNSQIALLTDFTDSQTACDVIRTNNIFSHYGGSELQLDATYFSFDQTSNFHVSWSSNEKRVLIFSDEQMQQEMENSVEDAINVVIEQCMNLDYTIGAFISYNVPHQSEWIDLTQGCGGFIDYLNQDPRIMIDRLNYWAGDDC